MCYIGRQVASGEGKSDCKERCFGIIFPRLEAENYRILRRKYPWPRDKKNLVDEDQGMEIYCLPVSYQARFHHNLYRPTTKSMVKSMSLITNFSKMNNSSPEYLSCSILERVDQKSFDGNPLANGFFFNGTW